MAASDTHPRSHPPSSGASGCLAAAPLLARLEEEVSRAERHGTPLSCLLVVIEDSPEIALAQSTELREQTLSYVADALGHELRRFDRIGRPSERELLILLPGADGPHGEVVARRMLERLRTIKVEVQGSRRELNVSVGLAAWQARDSAEDLLRRTRTAARLGDGDELGSGSENAARLLRTRVDPSASHSAP